MKLYFRHKSFIILNVNISLISQMNSKEKIAYHIAMDHLGTSFNLKKSIGYKEWLKKNKEKSDQK